MELFSNAASLKILEKTAHIFFVWTENNILSQYKTAADIMKTKKEFFGKTMLEDLRKLVSFGGQLFRSQSSWSAVYCDCAECNTSGAVSFVIYKV